ncbi:flagellar basal body rod protein FlgF [Providencia sneebia]|uniref:Flagellar basal-body rod protein FlgF n=1 Tax=Providencia sneebia DSM 19967 TaxID=1141660 RepID=K8WQY0_9GAMM|nr:flagellar basal body rod protein FlgF [Providencia sneebia DSM 19967]
MDHVIYTAMGGAQQVLESHAIAAHNIANISSTGFKAQFSAMRAVPVHGDTKQTRTLVIASTPGADISRGSFKYTGSPLDVVLNDNHFLSVELQDGREAYTQNGNIQISPEGELRIGKYRLIGDSGVITVPPDSNISITADGAVMTSSANDPNGTFGVIDQVKVVEAKPHDLSRGEEGLFHLSDHARKIYGNQLPPSDKVILTAGMVEGSNVNPAEAMVSMITLTRQFEMQMKVISCADENAQRANQLLTVS